MCVCYNGVILGATVLGASALLFSGDIDLVFHCRGAAIA
ncbi:hypothetical protein A2U01_0002460, partial [Trifolium medium]|nr:hypothetical protein [Trifolium medium]